MAGIQFFGKDAVLSAYKSRGIDTWAVFQGKDLISAGEGEAELATFLEMIAPHGSGAVYKLQVYSDNDNPDRITNKTECNGSVSFKLGDGNSVGSAGGVSRYVGDPIMNRLHGIVQDEVMDAIDKKLNGVEDDADETIGSVVMGYLKDPDKLMPLLAAIKGIFSPSNAQTSIATMPVNLATVAGTQSKDGAMTDAQLKRLSDAIDRLDAQDTRIVDHLEKLATLAETKPALFKMMLTQLDSL